LPVDGVAVRVDKVVCYTVCGVSVCLSGDITLPEIIGLPLGGLIPWKLPVYFVFDVAHGDEGDNDARPVTGIELSSNICVVDVVRGRELCTAVCLS